jgi:ABC-type amino acid transport substrate-binding protein
MRAAALLALAAALLAAGCTYPADPDGTLDRVEGGVLRAGVSPSPHSRAEMRLVERFAERLRARVEWVRDGEEHLVKRLEGGDLDVAVGGLTKTSPWKQHAALTRPYDGEHVMAAPLGENAWLVRLERFLLEEAR